MPECLYACFYVQAHGQLYVSICACVYCRELTLPIAKHLGVPKENVFANRMNWQWDDETGEPAAAAEAVEAAAALIAWGGSRVWCC
jgi:hypothetical protein